MDNEKEENLIIYEQSKEIIETVWKVWDLLNDIEIVTKLLLNSSLINELEKASLLNIKEDKISDKTNTSTSSKDKDKLEQKGNYL